MPDLPVIATLGEPNADVENTLDTMISVFNRAPSDIVRQAVFSSFILSMLMSHADPQRALMDMMSNAATGIAQAQRQLGQGGTG